MFEWILWNYEWTSSHQVLDISSPKFFINTQTKVCKRWLTAQMNTSCQVWIKEALRYYQKTLFPGRVLWFVKEGKNAMIMVRLSIWYIRNDKVNSCDCSNQIDSVGNQRFRMIIKLYVDEYMNSTRRVEKSKIVSKIVNNINNSAAGAGFVRKVSRYGTTVLCTSSCKTWTHIYWK